MAQDRLSVLLGPTGTPIRIGNRRPLRLSAIERELRLALKMTEEAPRRVGDGPSGFPLATLPEAQPFRWDSNCFYARLGVAPDAARVDIVRALQDSPRETAAQHLWYATAAKALLKRHIRRLYDALPLGSYLADDPSLIRSILPDDDEDRPLVPVDEVAGWSYYAEGSVTDEDVQRYDFSPIRTLLVGALSSWANGLEDSPYIGLGLTSRETRWVPVGYLPVLMLGVDEEVTEEYASQIAAMLQRSSAM
jgi:hypothetical protein